MPEFKGKKFTVQPDPNEPDSWLAVTCGHCGRPGQALVVARPKDPTTSNAEAEHTASATRWLWCTHCGGAIARDDAGELHPGVAYGPTVQGLPPEIEAAYSEARRCMSVRALNAAEMLCRKILMHVAVDKGASEGRTFASYLKHLKDEGYVTPPMVPWTDQIRKNANATNHEIPSPSRDRAESTVMFTAQLLRTVYEMNYLAESHNLPPVEQEGVEAETDG